MSLSYNSFPIITHVDCCHGQGSTKFLLVAAGSSQVETTNRCAHKYPKTVDGGREEGGENDGEDTWLPEGNDDLMKRCTIISGITLYLAIITKPYM